MTLTAVRSIQTNVNSRSPILATYTGSDPAAGSEWSETVPAGKLWRLLSVSSSLVTDATAANRRSGLKILDQSANELYRIEVGGSQTASTTVIWTFSSRTSGANIFSLLTTAGAAVGTIPDMLLMPGFVITQTTAGIVAGDNWGAPKFYVEEYSF